MYSVKHEVGTWRYVATIANKQDSTKICLKEPVLQMGFFIKQYIQTGLKSCGERKLREKV